MTDTTAAGAAPASEPIDYGKLTESIGASVGAAMAEAMKQVAADRAARKAEKKAKAEKAAENAAPAAAETKKAEQEEAVKESITPEQLEAKLVEERKNTIAELRESILKEGGLPSRQGYRRVDENDGGELSGDALWDKRMDVWAGAAPGIFGSPAA
jgi:hypothetical protein